MTTSCSMYHRSYRTNKSTVVVFAVSLNSSSQIRRVSPTYVKSHDSQISSGFQGRLAIEQTETNRQ